MKTKMSKKIISFALCAVMIATTFLGSGLASLLEAEAAITLTDGNWGITQDRVVTDYASVYPAYEDRVLNGFSEATNLVIPGLTNNDDYTPQGMTYWEAKNWVLISAYDASSIDRNGDGTINNSDKRNSVIYAIDVATGNFVALFKLLNADGTVNISHGGGIAASEYNFYYADSGSKISCIPLSEMNIDGGVKTIKLLDSVDLKGELNNAATSYCCYDDGVLWTGNFYIEGNDSYGTPANSAYENMLIGYKLHGNTSAEEWYFLKGQVLADCATTTQQTVVNGGLTMTYTPSVNGQYINISGNIADNGTGGTIPSEFTATFASFELIEGEEYTIEFTSDNDMDTDMYMFAPNGKHMDVNNTAVKTTSNGLTHFKLNFTAGLKPTGAESSWPTTQSTDGSFTGTYSIRFDQDSPSDTSSFNITNFRITPKNLYSEPILGKDMEGNPSYCIALPTGNDCDKVQYAMVNNGRVYISRSWSRKETTNHIRELAIADIDLSVPGTYAMTINGVSRNEYYVPADSLTKFYGSNMLYMGEALCVIDDYLYMFFESAAYTYRAKDPDSVCPEPVDVVWKIDQYALMGDTRTHTSNKTATAYKKVHNLSEITASDEYIIAFESSVKDPATGNNILYALDAFGGYDGEKLPKQLQGSTQASSGDSMGMVGNSITDYTVEGDMLYLRDPEDDSQSMRWKIIGAGTDALRIQNYSLYYVKYRNFYFGSRLMYMTTSDHGNLNNIKLKQTADGEFAMYYNGGGEYYLWCNDGSNQSYIDTYTSAYQAANSTLAYSGLTEIPGTFHCDGAASNAITDVNSGNFIRDAEGNRVSVDSSKMILHIYKRITADISSSGHSNLYTDLNAYLTADGTYTVELEAYATGATQKSVEDSGKPVDFVFVLDASASMTKNSDCYTFTQQTGGLSYDNTGSDGAKYYPYNGKFYLIEHTHSRSNIFQNYSTWIFITVDGVKYYFKDSSALLTTQPDATEKDKTTIYTGVYYTRNSNERFQTMKDSVNNFVDKINEDASTYNVPHRVSIIQFGSTAAESYYNTGMYSTSGTTMIQYNGSSSPAATDYEKAFYDANHPYIQTIVNSMTSPADADPDADTYVNHGFEMAYNTLAATGRDYSANGTHSACVIMFTDGVPGVGGNDATEATNSANEAIAYSKLCKDMNASVYSIQLGSNSISGFDMNAYMNYVSSNYPSATSMTNGGTAASTTFYQSASTDGSVQTSTVLDSVFESINNTVIDTGTAITLNGSSILRQTFGDKYIFDNAKTTVQTARIYYDSLGRLAEDTPQTVTSGITATTVGDSIQVNGFNYSEKYIADGHEGEKLIVKIEGLVIDPTAINTNAEVSDSAYTAIYKDTTDLGTNTMFKNFPQAAFSVPEYTYVLDYGTDMLDIDVNGTMKSIDTAPVKQTTMKSNINGTQSNIRIDGENLVYSITPHAGLSTTNPDSVTGKTSGYVLIQRDSGKYDWFKINVLPASNVLFEENFAELKSGNGVSAWTTDGTPANQYQSVSNVNDVYGYDANYSSDSSSHSNGTAYKATVSSSTPKSQTASFSFTGTGFDLISACSTNTGIQTVVVKQGTSVKKVYIVDTYYNDTYGTLKQVPVVHHEGDYGTYTVESTATYLSFAGALKHSTVSTNSVDGTELETQSAPVDAITAEEILTQIGMEELIGADVELVWMDKNSILNGGTGAEGSALSTQAGETASVDLVNYIDGYRIYNPLQDDSQYISSETNATYYNVIDSIGTGFTGNSLVAYVEGGAGDTEITFGNYTANGGPNNEVYLEKGNAVAFKFTVNALANPHAMVSLRAASGTTTAQVGSASYTLSSATEMYYNITNYLSYEYNADGSIVCIATITNKGDGLLAVGNIKIVNATLVPIATTDLVEVASLMTMAATPVDFNAPKVDIVENGKDNNAKFVPDRTVRYLEPDIDPKGKFILIYPQDIQNSSDNDITDIIANFFESLVNRLLAIIKTIINSIMLIKEV